MGESCSAACLDAELTPTVKELQQRVVAKFMDAGNVMVDSHMGRVRCKSTHHVLGRAIEAINNTFDQQRARLCRSPERPDLTISKEEALGWLLAEMFNCELLVPEARGLGKRVGKQISVTVKNEKAEITTKAKTARSEARKAAKKDEDLEALLDTTIRQIDAVADTQRTAVDARVYELNLPTAKIVTAKAKPAPKPEPERETDDEPERDAEFDDEVDLLARRRTVLEQANENGRASSKALVEFQREFDKLEAAMERERKPKLKKVTRRPVAEDEVGATQAFEYFADSSDALRSYQEALLTYEQRQSSLALQRAHLARLQDAVTRACRDFDVAMEEYELQMARVEAVAARRREERERLEAEVETARRKFTRATLMADTSVE